MAFAAQFMNGTRWAWNIWKFLDLENPAAAAINPKAVLEEAKSIAHGTGGLGRSLNQFHLLNLAINPAAIVFII